uniref:Uncharacterized protein n=1 Tax=Dunaliella tertiolecta TaxID=3047 RepID=A0A7S3QVQ1_DUNTE|mmetsp:Transcript_17713/g.46439  ORF Transcript_17713/g.46439 Transcript_17713/m.46439 type:complete len:123 (+) Transcript_17713:266-634(+)
MTALSSFQEYSALDQFCGRFPSKAVREMAGDAAFMASLLGSLSPSISPTTPCIAAVVLGLQGKSVLAGPLGCVDSMPAAPAPSSEPPSPTPMPVHASKPPGLSMVPGSREQPEQGKHSPWGK